MIQSAAEERYNFGFKDFEMAMKDSKRKGIVSSRKL